MDVGEQKNYSIFFLLKEKLYYDYIHYGYYDRVFYV